MSQLELVAYHCPQCGGNVKIDSLVANVKCLHCDCVLKVEPKRADPSEKKPRSRGADKPPPFLPPREPTVVTKELGRYDVTLLRQSITETAGEAMVWVPLDEKRAGVYLVRVVEEGKGSSAKPVPGPLGEIALAMTRSLRERRDPGLAVKAALRALEASRAPGMLEAFAGVFDSDRSELVTLNAGVNGVLVHASVEEGRTMSGSWDRGSLDRRQLRTNNQDAFANRSPTHLARGDVLVVSSLGERRSIHEALDKHWNADSLEIARAVHTAYWDERINSWDAHVPPVGDVLIIGVRVRGNSEIRSAPDVPLTVKSFRSKLFDIAIAPAEGAFVDWRPLHSNRHQLVWLEGPGVTREAGEKIVAAALEVSDGQTGDNDNPRRAGRDAGIPGGVKALVIQVHDVHGKLSYWTRHWKSGFTLGTRSDRTPTHQQFDEGGDSWPRDGGRLLVPGELPITKAFAHLDQLPYHWQGGKASCLYELCKDHEDFAASESFVKAAAVAARRDDPNASLNGLGAVTRLPE